MEKFLEKYTLTDQCPVRNILDRFGDKWSILVIMILGEGGVMRFKELNRAISDISQKMLTVTLRTLEADGLISRTIYPEIPPRVEYELTNVGRSLLPHIRNLSDWAADNFEVIEKSRKAFYS
jgi:DNA-binding HxlR family transcriptional regulator